MADLRGSETQVNVGRKYKSRKERPCDACRKRKICCTRDAYEKDCSLCRTRGESCQYILPPNVRRNRPSAARPSISTSSSSSSSSVPSRPAQTLAEHTAAANPSKSTTGKWICEFVGFSSDQDPFVLRHCSFNHHNCYKSTDWAVLRVKGDSEIPLHFTVIPDTHLDTHPEYYPTTDTEAAVSPNGPNLLRTYFDVIHLSYPLLDPSRFNSRPQTGDPLLAVMYNLAAPYCQTSPATFSQISSFVHQALPVERRHPRLETLEASLLHLQRHTTIYRSHTLPGLWSDVGALVGMAHDLGLNMDPTAWSLSAADSNRRVRIWWGLYIQDKWSALGLGRPSYLNDENCNVPLPTVDNFSHVGLHSEPLGLMPAVQFVAMANLATILSDLLNTFYTMKAMERIKLLPIEMLYSILNEFQGRLHVFHDEHLCQLYNVNTLLDSSGSVLLAYYTSEIVLFRAMLRCLPLNHPGYGGIRAQAKTTLLAVVDFLENLNVSRLRAFWWSPMTRINFSLVGTFMFFQLLTSITAHDIEFWSTTIAHYRSLLRLQSHSFDMTKLASARMDLLAAGMGVDPPMPTPDTLASSPDGTALSPTQGFMGGGVGLIGNPDGGFGQPELNGSGGERKLVLGPQAAEEWISRQGGGDGGGHTGLLGSAFGNTCMR